jgi:hypothetical protein
MTKNSNSPQALARQKRAAAALKANLKKRKEAAAEQPQEQVEDQAKRTA